VIYYPPVPPWVILGYCFALRHAVGLWVCPKAVQFLQVKTKMFQPLFDAVNYATKINDVRRRIPSRHRLRQL